MIKTPKNNKTASLAVRRSAVIRLPLGCAYSNINTKHQIVQISENINIQEYRYISARTLLKIPKLDRCQSLPQDTWTPAEQLLHLVFISHRWGSENDPDPSGSQLIALKSMVQKMVDIAEIISDERVGEEATRDRLARVPSLRRQGTLQAAHLVFRVLCGGQSLSVSRMETIWNEGSGILDLIGFWYDYSCLPQDPKTPDEELEFAQTLQGIGDMILSPQVSTLILRKEGDGYLSRGWCFAESMIARSKNDIYLPLVLRTDKISQPFSTFDETLTTSMMPWEYISNDRNSWELLSVAIQTTATQILLQAEHSLSEFSLSIEDTVSIGMQLFAHIQPHLIVLKEGEYLDLSVYLKTLLHSQGLGCREEKDYILVSLLLLKSLISEDSMDNIAIWNEAIVRFTEGLSLRITRCKGTLKWQ